MSEHRIPIRLRNVLSMFFETILGINVHLPGIIRVPLPSSESSPKVLNTFALRYESGTFHSFDPLVLVLHILWNYYVLTIAKLCLFRNRQISLNDVGGIYFPDNFDSFFSAFPVRTQLLRWLCNTPQRNIYDSQDFLNELCEYLRQFIDVRFRLSDTVFRTTENCIILNPLPTFAISQSGLKVPFYFKNELDTIVNEMYLIRNRFIIATVMPTRPNNSYPNLTYQFTSQEENRMRRQNFTISVKPGEQYCRLRVTNNNPQSQGPTLEVLTATSSPEHMMRALLGTNSFSLGEDETAKMVFRFYSQAMLELVIMSFNLTGIPPIGSMNPPDYYVRLRNIPLTSDQLDYIDNRHVIVISEYELKMFPIFNYYCGHYLKNNFQHLSEVELDISKFSDLEEYDVAATIDYFRWIVVMHEAIFYQDYSQDADRQLVKRIESFRSSCFVSCIKTRRNRPVNLQVSTFELFQRMLLSDGIVSNVSNFTFDLTERL